MEAHDNEFYRELPAASVVNAGTRRQVELQTIPGDESFYYGAEQRELRDHTSAAVRAQQIALEERIRVEQEQKRVEEERLEADRKAAQERKDDAELPYDEVACFRFRRYMYFFLFVFYGGITLLFAVPLFKDSYKEAQRWTNNWKMPPISHISVVPKSEPCPEGYENAPFELSHNEAGETHRNEVFCENRFCYRRSRYLKDFTYVWDKSDCEAGYYKCLTGGCVPFEDRLTECPVTEIELKAITPSQNHPNKMTCDGKTYGLDVSYANYYGYAYLVGILTTLNTNIYANDLPGGRYQSPTFKDPYFEANLIAAINRGAFYDENNTPMDMRVGDETTDRVSLFTLRSMRNSIYCASPRRAIVGLEDYSERALLFTKLVVCLSGIFTVLYIVAWILGAMGQRSKEEVIARIQIFINFVTFVMCTLYFAYVSSYYTFGSRSQDLTCMMTTEQRKALIGAFRDIEYGILATCFAIVLTFFRLCITCCKCEENDNDD